MVATVGRYAPLRLMRPLDSGRAHGHPRHPPIVPSPGGLVFPRAVRTLVTSAFDCRAFAPTVAAGLVTVFGATVQAQAGVSALAREIDQRAPQLEAKAVAWRRDIHQHPELSNREVRTSKLVADHLRSLGIEVKTGVAKTGVVGV